MQICHVAVGLFRGRLNVHEHCRPQSDHSPRYSTAVASELHASVCFFFSLENVSADNTDACGAVKMSVCSRFKSLPAGRMDMLLGCQSPGC